MSDEINFAKVEKIVDGALDKLSRLMDLVEATPSDEIDEWMLCCMWATCAIGEGTGQSPDTVRATFARSMKMWSAFKQQEGKELSGDE